MDPMRAILAGSAALFAASMFGLWLLRDGTRLSAWLDRNLDDAVKWPGNVR